MKFLKLAEVLDKVGLSKSSIRRLMIAGDFPKPAKIKGINLWVEAEVNDWMSDALCAART